MVCRRWSQPDPNHWRGLCANELFAEGSANTCSICVQPIGITPGTCGCPFPLKPHMIHYLRVSWISPPSPANCVTADPIGDFIITGCGGGYSVEDVTTVNSLAPVGTPLCRPYTAEETLRQKRYQVLIGESYLAPDGKRYATVEVSYRRRLAVWSGPTPPFYVNETPYTWDGVIAACDNRGSARLLQRGTLENPVYTGIFGPTIRAILSTEPFE